MSRELPGRFFIVLASCPIKDGDVVMTKSQAELSGRNDAFGTLRVFRDEEEAKMAARSAFNRYISRWTSKGYVLRCLPKTIDSEFHNWRIIARMSKPGERRATLAVQVLLDYTECYFNGWMF